MPVVFDTFPVQYAGNRGSGKISFLQKFFLRVLRRPLKGSERLWDEKGGACHNLHPSRPLFFGNRLIKNSRYFITQIGNSSDILLGLHGEPQHKIQLHPRPAAFKSHSCPFQNDLLGQSFVNNISKSLASRLRRKRKTAFFYILNLVHHIQGKGVNAQGRKRNIDLPPPALINQKINQPGKLCIIAGA